jgi:hypothetical protein
MTPAGLVQRVFLLFFSPAVVYCSCPLLDQFHETDEAYQSVGSFLGRDLLRRRVIHSLTGGKGFILVV